MMLSRNRSTTLRKGASAAALLLLAAAPAWSASFTPLGFLGGPTPTSQSYGMSADGSVVVGGSQSTNGNEAFRWDGTMAGLGDFANGIFDSRANATSSDGSVVVGFGDGINGTTGFTWNTTTTTLTALAPLPTGTTSVANGVSGDGLTAVGASDSAQGLQATSWTGGGATPLGFLTGGTQSRAHDASADGLVIVGDSDSTGGMQAFVWTVGTGMQGLGDLDGGPTFDSQAFAVSPDGTIVVGRAESASGDQAFFYQGGTMTGLGDLGAPVFGSVAYDVNDAGVVAGSASGTTFDEAVYWDANGQIHSILDVLVAEGLAGAVAGWSLVEARAVSADGLTFAGWGFDANGDTQAWIATIPEPSTGLLLGLGLVALAARRARG